MKHFYIPEEQSIYLLSQEDARKFREWEKLCIEQLKQQNFTDIEFIGKGKFGYVFGGRFKDGKEVVFKFSRMNLQDSVKDRMEEEAFMLKQIRHDNVPTYFDFWQNGDQNVLLMERARGINLQQYSLKKGRLKPQTILNIAFQLSEILIDLRKLEKPIVHGDIKPANLVFDEETEKISLIDWGSSVFAQENEFGESLEQSLDRLVTDQAHQSNARMGDIYFIGEEQLNGELSSPRFDEQGTAATLYALASGQPSRFGHEAIPASSLRLPKEFAILLDGMLSLEISTRKKAGNFYLKKMKRIKNIVCPKGMEELPDFLIPARLKESSDNEIDSVVYSSRKSFLRQEMNQDQFEALKQTNLDDYYKDFLDGVSLNAKAFLASLNRLAKFPLIGGIAIEWKNNGVYIDSFLELGEQNYQKSFAESLNNTVELARAIRKEGLFKTCFFNAKKTLHLSRSTQDSPFALKKEHKISFDIQKETKVNDHSRVHSYFEDGKDEEEFLELPKQMIQTLQALNKIHHTGCIIFEVKQLSLKIHSYFILMNPSKEQEFELYLRQLLEETKEIRSEGVAGFMKFPYKNTRFFSKQEKIPDQFMPLF